MINSLHFKRLISLLLLLFSISPGVDKKGCSEGKELIFFDFDNSIKTLLPEGFARNFSKHLKTPLSDIGYCLSELNSIAPDSGNRNSMIMLFSISKNSGSDTFFTMQIDLVKTIEAEGVQRSQSSSFISLSFGSEELSTVETVLIRKIVENLRMQYVCHLRIHSSPQGVHVRTDSGLEGITPLEWVIPVGVLTINGEQKGYETIQRTLDISEPGVHTCFLQLHRRQFYHSKMMFPATAFLLTSAVCFISERYYYNNFYKLKKSELETNPELYEKTHDRAKRFGLLGTTSLMLSCVSFALTFKF